MLARVNTEYAVKLSYRCQSKAELSINALIMLSSSSLLTGGASCTGMLDAKDTGSGIAYRSFPNSSQSKSSYRGQHMVLQVEMKKQAISYTTSSIFICLDVH